jgi:hypothetical protein
MERHKRRKNMQAKPVRNLQRKHHRAVRKTKKKAAK